MLFIHEKEIKCFKGEKVSRKRENEAELWRKTVGNFCPVIEKKASEFTQRRSEDGSANIFKKKNFIDPTEGKLTSTGPRGAIK